MTLPELRDDVMKAPTMMEVDEELVFMNRLMEFPLETVRTNKEDLFAILGRLYESHMQAFYDVDAGNLPALRRFAGWLRELAASSPTDNERLDLQSLAEHFEIEPD